MKISNILLRVDRVAPHRSSAPLGAKLFIVD